MNRTWLQIIAILTMTIDHIAMILIPISSRLYMPLRYLGRLSFPLFAFMIAEGYHHTRNRKKYFLRLFIVGITIELLLDLFSIFIFSVKRSEMNIFLTLAFGLLALILINQQKFFMKLFTIPIFIYLFITKTYCGSIIINNTPIPLGLEYDFYGISLIILFGLFNSFDLKALSFIIITFVFTQNGLAELFNMDSFVLNSRGEIYALGALIPIYFYNGKKGIQIPKAITYLYYPLHLLFLYLISYLVK